MLQPATSFYKTYLHRPAVQFTEYAVTATLMVLFLAYLLIVPKPDAIRTAGEIFWGVLLGLACLVYAVSLSFEAWQRISRFRLSRFHPLMDLALSVVVVTLPFLFVVFGVFPLALLSLLMAYSYHVSPDRVENATKDSFYKRFYYFLLNGVFLTLIFIAMQMFRFNYA